MKNRPRPEAETPQADPAVVVATLETLANRYKAERDRIEQELVSMTVQAQAHARRAVELQTQLDLIEQARQPAEGAN